MGNPEPARSVHQPESVTSMTTHVPRMKEEGAPVLHRFTVDDYYRMAEVGVLKRDDRVELLDGQVVEMSPIGNRHSVCVALLTKFFSAQVADHAEVWIQNPVQLDEFNEPEPDVALVRAPLDRYLRAKPGPEDVFLLIEVSQTSVGADRSIKIPLYAKAGYREVWLVDLQLHQMEIHRSPEGGRYTEVAILKRTDAASPGAFPDIRIDLTSLFPVN